MLLLVCVGTDGARRATAGVWVGVGGWWLAGGAERERKKERERESESESERAHGALRGCGAECQPLHTIAGHSPARRAALGGGAARGRQDCRKATESGGRRTSTRGREHELARFYGSCAGGASSPNGAAREDVVERCRTAFDAIANVHGKSATSSADYYVTRARFEEFIGNVEGVAELFATAARHQAQPAEVLEAAFMKFLRRQVRTHAQSMPTFWLTVMGTERPPAARSPPSWNARRTVQPATPQKGVAAENGTPLRCADNRSV